MADLTAKASAPLRTPGIDAAIARLDADLTRLLGSGTEFCLVVAQDCPDLLNVQAMTNTSPRRAHLLLRAVDGVDFDPVTR